MFFVEALVDAIRGAFRFSGRSERTEIWALVIVTWVIWFALIGPFQHVLLESARAGSPVGIQKWIDSMLHGEIWMACYIIIAALILSFLGWARLMVEIRRLHDLNMSGIWIWIPVLVPMFAYSIAILLMGGVSFLPALPESVRADISPFVGIGVMVSWSIASTVRLFIVWKTLFFRGDEKDNAYGPPP